VNGEGCLGTGIVMERPRLGERVEKIWKHVRVEEERVAALCPDAEGVAGCDGGGPRVPGPSRWRSSNLVQATNDWCFGCALLG
jgi:hypothetical protein